MAFLLGLGLELPALLPAAVALLVVYVVQRCVRTPRNIPPMPVRPFPLLGHFPYLRGAVRETLLEYRKTTGDIFSVYFGGTLVVVLSSYEVLTEALVKQADAFSARPLDGTIAVVGYTEGILSGSGELWKENRSVTLAAFKKFGMGKSLLADKVLEELTYFLEKLSSLKGESSYVGNTISCAISNVTCNIVVGRRFEYEDPEYEKFISASDRIMRCLGGGFLHQWYPQVKYLPGDFFKAKELISAEREFLAGMRTFIAKVIQEEHEGTCKENLISEYLKVMRKKQEAGKQTELSMKCLERVVFELMVAGIETTATVFTWFCLYMLHFPGVQNKIYTEILTVIGPDRCPTLEDKPRLSYTNAAIMETLRLCSATPFAGFHRCSEETRIRGYTVPKDTMVLTNLDSVLLDEKIWGDPLNFRPERFLNDGELVIPEQFIAFSLGRRYCMGAALAKVELYLFATSLVQRFEMLPEDPNCLPPRQYRMGATCPLEPYKISGFHRCSEETRIRGYTVPKDTMVLTNLDSVLLDEKIWGDPLNFRPERFLNDGELVIPEQFIAFSLGRRYCMGAALAKVELYLFATSLVQRFEMLPEDPNCLPPRQYRMGATCPPEPYKIRFVERSAGSRSDRS